MLPTDKQERKERPMFQGLLNYFPDALAEVSHVSFKGNQQHNPGEPLHWAREKSSDHEDCIIRHLTECGTIDDDGLRHTAKLAWRSLALLQLELEHAHPADCTCDDCEPVPPCGTTETDDPGDWGEASVGVSYDDEDEPEPGLWPSLELQEVEPVRTIHIDGGDWSENSRFDHLVVPGYDVTCWSYSLDVPWSKLPDGMTVTVDEGGPDGDWSDAITALLPAAYRNPNAVPVPVNDAVGEALHQFYEDLCDAPWHVADLLSRSVRIPNDESVIVSTYIAGPMRGLPDFNFPAFDAASRELVKRGYLVMSPAEIDREAGFNQDTDDANSIEKVREFVLRDFFAIFALRPEEGDVLTVLPGWEKSTGALAEVALARWLQIPVRTIHGEPVGDFHAMDIVDGIDEHLSR